MVKLKLFKGRKTLKITWLKKNMLVSEAGQKYLQTCKCEVAVQASNISQVLFCKKRSVQQKKNVFRHNSIRSRKIQGSSRYIRKPSHSNFKDIMYYVNLHSTHTFYTSIKSHELEHSFKSVEYSRKYSITFAI